MRSLLLRFTSFRLLSVLVTFLLLSATGPVSADPCITGWQKISAFEGGLQDPLCYMPLFGRSAVSIGDLDGDGVTDLAVGAPNSYDNAGHRGAIYILFLNSNGTVKAEQKIGDGIGGFPSGVLSSAGEVFWGKGDRFGNAIASLGDLDGDGVTDLAVGAPADDDEGRDNGSVWVLFLNSDGTVKSQRRIAHSEIDWFDDYFGYSLEALGDLDGDGVIDLAVGAPGDDDGGASPAYENEGALFILFMRNDGTVKSRKKISETQGGNTPNFPAAPVYTLPGFAKAIACVGDLDGNGVSDLAVQSGWAFSSDHVGSVYILFLSTSFNVLSYHEITEAEVTGITAPPYTNFGYSLGMMGDISCDGLDAPVLAVGAIYNQETEPNAGALHLLSLNPDGTVAAQEKIREGLGGFAGGVDYYDYFGGSVCAIGDLDGNGSIDFAVGAPRDDDDYYSACGAGNQDGGAVWILFTETSAPATVTVSGTVTSDCNGPVAGADVTVTDAMGVATSTTTDAAGQYSVAGIAYSTAGGTVEIASPTGYAASGPISVALDADQTVDVELSCVYTSVSGGVESGCGAGALAGVDVTLTPPGGTALSTTTATDGSFSFSGLRASDLTADLAVVPPTGYDPFPATPGDPESVVDITTDQSGIVVALTCQPGSIAGSVTADCPAADTPLDGVQVDAYQGGAVVGSALTDASGAYAITGLFAGDYTLIVVPPAGYDALVNNVAVTVAPGEAANAVLPLVCQPGSVAGQVTIVSSYGTECPPAGSGVNLVEIDAYEVGTGDLVATGVTDENGDYAINGLASGEYVLRIIRPISLGIVVGGFEVAVTVPPGETTTADFPTLVCVDIAPAPLGIGAWSREVAFALTGHPGAKYTPDELCLRLDLIAAHFNSNAINQVIVYEPPASDVCSDKLQVAKELLNLRGKKTKLAMARAQFLALLFNTSVYRLQLFDVITEDGATLSQAVTYVDHLLDDPAGDYNLAKSICGTINSGELVPAGVIPLDTDDIAYSQFSPETEETPSAEELTLGQNYPNPFNPTTSIRFVVDQSQHVDLSIYNAAGRLVRTLVSGQMSRGTYVEEWDGRDAIGREVSTGIYFYRLKTTQATLTRKMILLK